MASESENENKIFKNLLFSLITHSKDLTEKRAVILKDIIRTNGGSILETHNINEENSPDYIISAKNLSNIRFEEKIENVKIQTKLKSKVIDLKWITDCVRVGRLLETDFYLVFSFDSGGFDKFNFKKKIDNLSSAEEISNESKKHSSIKKPKLESKRNPRELVKGNFNKKDDYRPDYTQNSTNSLLFSILGSKQEGNKEFLNDKKPQNIFKMDSEGEIDIKAKGQNNLSQKSEAETKQKKETKRKEINSEYEAAIQGKSKSKKTQEKTNPKSKSKPKANIDSKKPLSFFKTDDELAENKKPKDKEDQNLNLIKDLNNNKTKNAPKVNSANVDSILKNLNEKEKELDQEKNKQEYYIPKAALEIEDFKKPEIEKNTKNDLLIHEDNQANRLDVNLGNSKDNNNDKKRKLKKTEYKDHKETEDEQEAKLESEFKLVVSSNLIKHAKTFQSDKKQNLEKEKEYDITSFQNLYRINDKNDDDKEDKIRFKIDKKILSQEKQDKLDAIEASINEKILNLNKKANKNKNNKKANQQKSAKAKNEAKTKGNQYKNTNASDQEKNSFDEIELSFTEEAKNAIDTDRNSKNIHYDFTGATDTLTDLASLSAKASDLDIPERNKIYTFSNSRNADNNIKTPLEDSSDSNFKHNAKSSKNLMDIDTNANTNTVDSNAYKSKRKIDKTKFAFYKGNKNAEIKANANNVTKKGGNKTILESDNELNELDKTNIKNPKAEDFKEAQKLKLNKLVINPDDHFSMSYEDSESPNEIYKILNNKIIQQNIDENFSQSPSEGQSAEQYDNSNSRNTINKKNNKSKKNKRYSNKKSNKSNENQKDSKTVNNIITINSQGNLNSHITDQLERMLEYHVEENDTFETLAYRRAISQLKNAKEKVTNESQLSKYKYLGKSIKQKIKEILATGTLKKLDYLKKDEKNIAINKLKTVHGIGLQFANKLYLKGIKSIEDLRRNQDLLNHTQKIGLKYYEDLIQRITRSECEAIFAIIKETVCELIPEEALKIELCGSFRRGKQSIGDLDVLLTATDTRNIHQILSELVQKLYEKGLIKETLSLSKEEDNLRKHTFMGICRLNGTPHRRLDIKIYNKDSFPFALLYFTGSAYFNRSLRLYAKNHNFSLSDNGLIKHDPLKPNDVGKNIKCGSEDDIFKALGLEYKPPSERDI